MNISKSPTRMDLAAIPQISDVQWDSAKGRFVFTGGWLRKLLGWFG